MPILRHIKAKRLEIASFILAVGFSYVYGAPFYVYIVLTVLEVFALIPYQSVSFLNYQVLKARVQKSVRMLGPSDSLFLLLGLNGIILDARPSFFAALFLVYGLFIFVRQSQLAKTSLRGAVSDINRDKISFALVLLLVVLLLILGLSSVSALSIGIFFFFLLYKWNSKALILAAVLLIFVSCVFLMFDNAEYAAALSAFSYISLTVAASLEILRYFGRKRGLLVQDGSRV